MENVAKIIGLVVVGFLGILFITCLGAFIGFLIWNHLAPIYFTDILPKQFLHIPFFHFWGFTYLASVFIKSTTTTTKSSD